MQQMLTDIEKVIICH